MPREAVTWFAEQMERKLAVHDGDRGEHGWTEDICDTEFLMARLEKETRELIEVLYEYGSPLNTTQAEKVIGECVDVANFAMMIADQARLIVDRNLKEIRILHD